MKHILPVFIFIFVLTSLQAQININNTTFPNEGTVLKYFSRNNPTNVLQGPAGENRNWNFNNLSGGQPVVEKYVNVSEGKFNASFPDANILILNSQQTDGEQYGRILNSRIEIVGFGGPNPFFGGEIAIPYKKRPQIRRSPMFYETSAFSEGLFNLTFPASILPDTLLANLPIRPDSLRVTFTSVKNDTIDAWGKIQLKNKEFDVLREKSVIISSNKLEIKIPIIGWFDVSTLFSGGAPGGGPAFGNDTSIVYSYYTNTRKDVLVSISTDNRNQVTSVEYADIDNTINTFDFSANTGNLLYPNPVSERLFFENEQMKPGNYTARLVHMNGSIISESLLIKEENKPFSLDINHLSNGKYFLVLYPEKGVQVFRAGFVVGK
jgi:hypothetical protein